MSAPESRWARMCMVVMAAVSPMLVLAQQPTAALGQQIATEGTPQGVVACMGCHGAQGEGSAAFPHLAGSGQAYLQAQLDAFAEGRRKNPVMQPFAQKLSATERTALAMYYSQLKPSFVATGTPSPSPNDAGAWLAARGRGATQLPACVQCHGPGGTGVGTQFPPLAGQPVAYITEQLQAWKAGTRAPGPLGLMPVVASKLSDKDIDMVAAHYAGLTVPPTAPATPTATKTLAVNTAFVPPPESAMPGGDYGKVIRLGEQVFMQTGKYASRYVGNDLSCANCHLDAGRKSNSAPLWAAFIHYPAFRSKTGKVDTLASRIQGCFEFSMNGKAPPQDDEIMTALQTYAFWLAQGAPVGTPVPGSGYPKLKKPAQPADYARGEKVYAQNCALCHGADGLGQRAADHQVFPPLWGPRSFNWGAGMHQLGNAAGFIQANMPLGKGGTLSEQEAWDVAMFINSHERPQDPRFTGSVEETRKTYHDNPADSMYGSTVNGHVLGSP